MVVYQAVQWDKMIEETAEVEKKKKKKKDFTSI